MTPHISEKRLPRTEPRRQDGAGDMREAIMSKATIQRNRLRASNLIVRYCSWGTATPVGCNEDGTPMPCSWSALLPEMATFALISPDAAHWTDASHRSYTGGALCQNPQFY
jgi:hypothetical protein